MWASFRLHSRRLLAHSPVCDRHRFNFHSTEYTVWTANGDPAISMLIWRRIFQISGGLFYARDKFIWDCI